MEGCEASTLGALMTVIESSTQTEMHLSANLDKDPEGLLVGWLLCNRVLILSVCKKIWVLERLKKGRGCVGGFLFRISGQG